MSQVVDQAVSEVSYFEAINQALVEEMERDGTIIVLGNSVESGLFGATTGLLDRFGPRRVRDTPISEATITGVAVGAAMCGLRPWFDYEVASFALVAMDQLVHQAAQNRFLFGGQATIPAVFSMQVFHRSRSAAQHTDRLHAMLMNVPGLKIVAPQTPFDAKALLKTSLRSDDPIVYMTDGVVAGSRGPVGGAEELVPLGEARVARAGTDATVVSVLSLKPALEAAERLAEEGISVEVIDPRTFAPLDLEAILGSVRRTRRAVIADIAHQPCSTASEIAACLFEELFYDLEAPVQRVCAPPVHVPFAPSVEARVFPDTEQIMAAVRQTFA